MQDLLASRRQAGERSWRHHHYLRGSLICASCGRRIFFTRAKGRHGGLYDYFVCGGRSAGICTQPYHRTEAVEYAVEQHYATIQLTAQQRERIRTAVHTHLDALAHTAAKETRRARAEVTRLDNEERKLLAAHYNDTITPHIYAEEHTRIREQRRAAEELLRRYELNQDQVAQALDMALELTHNIQAAYLNADHVERRLLNQGFFEHLEIDNEEITNDRLAPPFAQIHALANLTEPQGNTMPEKARTPDDDEKVGGSYLPLVVELTGLEPPTFRADCWARHRHRAANRVGVGRPPARGDRSELRAEERTFSRREVRVRRQWPVADRQRAP